LASGLPASGFRLPAELDTTASRLYFAVRLINHMVQPNDALTTTFAALADPTRRAILSRLAGGELSVTELAEPFDISLPAVSKHLNHRRADAGARHRRQRRHLHRRAGRAAAAAGQRDEETG
jgi:DNA-binding transcriptional ArsR family regulator